MTFFNGEIQSIEKFNENDYTFKIDYKRYKLLKNTAIPKK